MEYNFIDLFHGAGGFSYGAWLAGMKFKNHFCSDTDKSCQKLFKLRFPDSIQLGDVTKINYEELKKNYGENWIITGGFPCQPHSLSGKRKASLDGRDLSDECITAIRVLRPRFAIFENVPGLLISEHGLFFNRFLDKLAEIGYDVEWQDIRASDLDFPHERERIWVIAYPRRLGWNGGDVQGHNKVKQTYKRTTSKETQRYLSTKRIIGLRDCNDIRRGARVPGWMDRLKQCGNSIVPQIAELLFNLTKESL